MKEWILLYMSPSPFGKHPPPSPTPLFILATVITVTFLKEPGLGGLQSCCCQARLRNSSAISFSSSKGWFDAKKLSKKLFRMYICSYIQNYACGNPKSLHCCITCILLHMRVSRLFAKPIKKPIGSLSTNLNSITSPLKIEIATWVPPSSSYKSPLHWSFLHDSVRVSQESFSTYRRNLQSNMARGSRTPPLCPRSFGGLLLPDFARETCNTGHTWPAHLTWATRASYVYMIYIYI